MRILFIDAARAVAILGACGHHALLLRVSPRKMEMAERVFSATALGFMPLFLLLFGVALELVYYRRAVQTGLQQQARRLFHRALLCYGCFLATIAVPAALGRISPTQALRMSLLLERPAFYNDILPLWVVLLALAAPLLRLRARIGALGMLAAGFAAWFVVPYLYDGPWPASGSPFAVSSGVLFGWPLLLVYSDLLHTFVYVGAGIFLGAAIARSRERGTWGEYRRALLLLGGAALALALLLVLVGDNPANWPSLGYRRNIRAGYGLFGMLISLAVIGVCSLLVRPRSPQRPRHRYLFGIGMSSLFAFTLSSCLLSLGRSFPGLFPAAPIPFALAHLALLASACAVVEWRAARLRASP